MSADGQGDSLSLNTEENSSANNETAANKTNLQVLEGSSSPSKVDSEQITTPVTISSASNPELQTVDDIETEQTLKPTEKEKALHVDNELDFELKWDDDGQGDSVSLNIEENSPANNVLEGSSSVPKVDSEQITSSVTILGSASNLELQTVNDIETEQTLKLTEKEKALDVNSELDFELKWDDDNELIPDDESKMDTDPVPNNEPDKPEISNEEANEQETNGESCNTEKQVEDTTNEQVAGKDDDEGDLLNTADEEKLLDNVNTENEDKVLDTNLKIDLASKVSPVESDTNSLDEHLVYSDVEAPEIEEKDLLDELDAHISPNNSNDEKLEIKIETPEILPKTGENSKKSSPQHILDSTAMDVDDLILLPVKKEEIPDVNDTLSSNTEMETSTYEVNNEHGLTKPDVMIEIPTQEYIEDFDDSGELSEEGEQYDEDILLNNDSNDIQKLVSDNRKVTSPIGDENRISVEKPVSGKPEDSSDKTKDKSKNVATEESHADIILEATNSEPKLTTIVQEHTADSKSTTDDEVQTTAEPKLMTNDEELKADSKSTKDDDAQPTAGPKLPTNNDEKLAAEPDDAEPIDEPKVITNDKVQPADDDMHPTAEPKSTMDDDVLPTAVTNVEEISFSTPFEATKEVDNCPGESGPNTIEAEDVSHSAELGASSPILELPKVSEAHDTSTYLEKTQGTEAKDGSSSDKLETKKLSDDKNVSSSEVVRPTEVAEPEIPSSTAEPKEASGKTDSAIEAQPSTSKYSLQELSDEDQEVTDSLGLLAESSRVMDDDDEQEQEHEDEDDDDDFDQDDESNQMTAEHSEDSNAQQSETDAPRESMEVEESPTTDKEEFQFPAEVEDTTGVAEALGDTAQAEEITDADVSETEKAVQALLGAETAEEPANDVSQDDASDDKQSDDMECVETEGASKLRQLLLKDKEPDSELPGEKKSPSKVKKLEITKPSNEINIVDLGGSSSEDDIQEVKKRAPPSPDARGVTSVNIPDAVEVMAAAAGCMSRMRRGSGELVISGVPRPPPHKPARLNTSEVSIKTVATEPIPLPDASASAQDGPAALKFGLEVFSLDSDDDDKQADQTPKKMTAIELDRVRQNKQCVNMYCTSDSTTPLLPCDARCAAYYGARRGAVCRTCALTVAGRTQSIIEGVREFAPLLSLDMGQTREELVEISDSDSEDEAEIAPEPESALGELGAKFLDENLADMFNATWNKFKLDDRLREAQDELDVLVNKMEGECTEIDAMLGECQQATDQLRRALYDSFAHERQELPAILIYDTPPNTWSGLEDGILAYENNKEIRQSKRRMAAATEPPAKRPAIPLGYAPLDSDASTAQNQPKPTASATEVPGQVEDDSGDISVVRLSAEAAPAGLPPPGPAARAPLRPGAAVFAMRNAYGTWHKAKIIDVQPKGNNQFTMCKVKFEHKVKNPCKLLPARCLAYDQPSEVRMTIGTRVIALFKDPNNSKAESYYSGIVAEIPNPVNNYRYLVFFDDGYAQYVSHGATRLVCECAKLVWDEVHPFSRQFVRDYLRAYPERPMVRAHAGQSLKTEWNGKWWVSRVVKVDASLVQVHFEEDDRYEWIYRGSTRLAPLYLELQAAERQRARPLPRAQPGRRFNMPYVEYTRSDEPAAVPASTPQQIEQEIRRQRAVAKKSTALPPAPAPAPAPTPLDGVTSRVVFYTPKNAIRPLKMKAHTCGPHCKRTDVLALKDLRTYNPLTKPLLSGWERQIVKYRWTRSVMYRAPCGRRIRDYPELHHYLQLVESEMGVDLFDFGVNTHCLAEFVLNKCFISKKDLSNGKESVPVPCVNYYDESLPEFCSYNTRRTPTVGVPLNLDPDFLCGCDCVDDCADKSKCACWRLTMEGARTIGFDGAEVGYAYKRLPEPLPSGIYECNSRCKCKQTCLNRVAQHPLQLKLQVFKTLNRGWGIRALNDVPRGAFLCVYAGNLLTDATANLDGLNEGDEYLAELDYIEVVEQMKEGFEEDIPDEDKRRDKEESGSSRSSRSSSSSDARGRGADSDDDDFRPAERLLPAAVPAYSKRLRKRDKKKKEGEEKEKKDKERSDDCITISDDEELREPARFSAQTGMGAAGFVSKYKSVRAHFGKDEACYIMDAKVQGNIGRYLNHSCTPNVFVQNVFVDTHDPRFPWVAFFALAHIRAGTELTWNYNYDVGSVPGKVLYCHCAAPNCRGRLL